MRRSMRGFILYAKTNGLSMSQIGALFHLRKEGACGVSAIGDNLGVTNAAASQMLDRLVRQALIARSEDPHDRRSKHIVLTEKGQRVLHESLQARQGWMDDLAQCLTPQEQDQVLAALNLLIEKADQLESAAAPER